MAFRLCYEISYLMTQPPKECPLTWTLHLFAQHFTFENPVTSMFPLNYRIKTTLKGWHNFNFAEE